MKFDTRPDNIRKRLTYLVQGLAEICAGMPWSEETFAGNAFVSKKEKDVKNKEYSLTSKMRMFNVKFLIHFYWYLPFVGPCLVSDLHCSSWYQTRIEYRILKSL